MDHYKIDHSVKSTGIQTNCNLVQLIISPPTCPILLGFTSHLSLPPLQFIFNIIQPIKNISPLIIFLWRSIRNWVVMNTKNWRPISPFTAPIMTFDVWMFASSGQFPSARYRIYRSDWIVKNNDKENVIPSCQNSSQNSGVQSRLLGTKLQSSFPLWDWNLKSSNWITNYGWSFIWKVWRTFLDRSSFITHQEYFLAPESIFINDSLICF